MNEQHEKRAKASVIVSGVCADGTLIETVYQPEVRQTALVLARKATFEVASTWKEGEAVHVPIRPTNNLIRHNALLLPSAPAPYENTEQLLAEICLYIRKYVLLSKQDLGLSAAYVLLSWVYDAFNELPYLRFRGDYGTGKTRALLVVGSLCYKAFFASGASTVSPIFHTLDTFKGTLIFDEADFRFTDEKAELVKILNNGNVKGFPVLRTQVTQAREFDPRAFTIFGPKIVGMRRSYDDRALESRFLTIEMRPGRPADVPINLPDIQKEEALQLRNKLLSYRLQNRLSVKLNPDHADPNLEPRLNQILLPLLSVASSPELRAAIMETARTLQARVISDRGASPEGQVLSVLVNIVRDRDDGHASLSEVAAAFLAAHGADYERPITNRWIGGLLRRLGLLLYKSNGVFVLLPGQQARIAALCTRYGIEVSASETSLGTLAQGEREIGTNAEGIQ
jgi:hypothetical protein